MMKIEPSILPSLAWFALIVRAGSFSRAASEMGITRAALSQNLKSLEERLNTKLIYRTTRNMSLTEEGQHLYEVLVSALGQIDDALKDVGDTQLEPTGLLRINSSRVAARMLVEPHIGEFLTRYPKTKIELIMDDGLSNIIADGCDVGIRLEQGLDEHMTAVPVSPLIKLVTVASPDYLKEHGIPETPQELSNHNCISNDDESMIRMALNGTGIIQHLDFAIAEHINAGKLQPILEDWAVSFPGFYIYVSSRVRMPSKVRAFIDFMVEKRVKIES